MYAIRSYGDAPLRTNAALREYARLEYRAEDAHWLLAASEAVRKAPRTPLRIRLLVRRARPSPRAVACKGSPRREVQETSPG